MSMKVVQTRVSDTEYSLLVAYATSRKSTIKDVVREAIRKLTISDVVEADDPLFQAFPLSRKKARMADASEKADRYLYGWDR